MFKRKNWVYSILVGLLLIYFITIIKKEDTSIIINEFDKSTLDSYEEIAKFDNNDKFINIWKIQNFLIKTIFLLCHD